MKIKHYRLEMSIEEYYDCSGVGYLDETMAVPDAMVIRNKNW